MWSLSGRVIEFSCPATVSEGERRAGCVAATRRRECGWLQEGTLVISGADLRRPTMDGRLETFLPNTSSDSDRMAPLARGGRIGKLERNKTVIGTEIAVALLVAAAGGTGGYVLIRRLARR